MCSIVSQHCHMFFDESDAVRWGCHLRRCVCSLRIPSLQPTHAYLWQGRGTFARSHQSVPRCIRLFSLNYQCVHAASSLLVLHTREVRLTISSECESP